MGQAELESVAEIQRLLVIKAGLGELVVSPTAQFVDGNEAHEGGLRLSRSDLWATS